MLFAGVQDHWWVFNQSFGSIAFEQSGSVSDVVYQGDWCSRIITSVLEKGDLVLISLLLHIWWHFVFEGSIWVVKIIGDLLVINPTRILICLESWCRHVHRVKLGLGLSSFLARNLGRHCASRDDHAFCLVLPMWSLHVVLITKCVLDAFWAWVVSRYRVLSCLLSRLWHQTISLRVIVDSSRLWRHHQGWRLTRGATVSIVIFFNRCAQIVGVAPHFWGLVVLQILVKLVWRVHQHLGGRFIYLCCILLLLHYELLLSIMMLTIWIILQSWTESLNRCIRSWFS